MIDYEKFFIVNERGYPELRFYENDDDEEGVFVCFVDAGDQMSFLLSKVNEFVPPSN